MPTVFNTYSLLKTPVDDLKEFINTDLTLPDGIKDVTVEKVNGRLHIESVPEDNTVGRYTPTAKLKGSIKTKRVVVDSDGNVTHKSPSTYKRDSGWSRMAADEELETVEKTYIRFEGWEDDVLVHKKLRYEMFNVLCQFATPSISGRVDGIVAEDDELNAVRIQAGGEEVDVELQVTERTEDGDRSDSSESSGQDQSDGSSGALRWK